MAKITQITSEEFISQEYNTTDENLISSFDVDTLLTPEGYIEFFVFDLAGNEIYNDIPFLNYKFSSNNGPNSSNNEFTQIILTPDEDLSNIGFDQGEYITHYNFLNKEIGENLDSLYISEISSDRTELRLDSNILQPQDIVELTNKFISKRENSSYFLDFYLNFGDNNLIISNNIKLEDENSSNPTILIKLYSPLPTEFELGSTLRIVTQFEEPVTFNVEFEDLPIEFNDTTPIKGPNFNIEIKDQLNNSTVEYSYNDLLTSNISSSQNQLQNLLENKEININIDYSEFSNFIHFSSAQKRLENFKYKIELLESYSASIAILENTTGQTTSSLNVLKTKENDILKNLDHYEYHLYYSSGSTAWPKTNSTLPYTLAKASSTDVLNWYGTDNEASPYYGGQILSASLFDNENPDYLYYSIPSYLREDPQNQPYELFVDMVAQHYDNIWIYIKDITNKFNADNRLNYGISKDLVADAIRDFGIKLYQNNFSSENLYNSFLGLTNTNSSLPFPNITSSYPTPSGFEYITEVISASNDILPINDYNKSIYKRLYHNIPYLLNTKGTIPGLRALISSYGIPDTILRINEYGGKDRVNSNDWDYWKNEFNYAFSTSDSNFISSSWQLNSDWNSPDNVPSTLMFRFKTNGLPTSNIPYSQSIWKNNLGSAITLTYTGSAYVSGSYLGSIKDPEYQYAHLKFYPDADNVNSSASLYLPFFDGDWWSVMLTRSGSEFNLYSQNKFYKGGDNNTQLGFQDSSTVTSTLLNLSAWTGSSISYFPVEFSISTSAGYDIVTYDDTAVYDGTGGSLGIYTPLSGAYQEIRYYATVISKSVFDDYTMNPYSTEGNSLNTSPNELAFRASLGGELHTGSVSIHPKVSGDWSTTHSFANNSNFYYDSSPSFITNTEYFFLDQPIAGIRNPISDKIRVENAVIPSGSTLSSLRSLAQKPSISQSYSQNINYLEVAFSPQNEINDDIFNQIGYFNIGEYIGDPRFRSSSLNYYPNLNQLRDDYFKKYTSNYDVKDFIRLIKYFDNSLFKMIKDFVPARTSLATGVVIKQHLLERNRYPQTKVNTRTTLAKYAKSGSVLWNTPIISQDITITSSVNPQWNNFQPERIVGASGGPGGVLNKFNSLTTSPSGSTGTGPNNVYGVTQSYSENIIGLSGSVLMIDSSQDEFYDGEFKGSVIIATTQSLFNPFPRSNNALDYDIFLYKDEFYPGYSSGTAEQQFLNLNTIPSDGELFILAPKLITKYQKGGGLYFSKGKAYIKINFNDCDGENRSVELGQIEQILIKYSTLTSPVTYKIKSRSKFTSYFLFEIETINIDSTGTNIDTNIRNYYISASITSSRAMEERIPPLDKNPIYSFELNNWDTVNGNSLNYFNTSSGYYTFEDTPNVKLIVTASITTDGNPQPGDGFVYIFKNQTPIASSSIDIDNPNVTTIISASFLGNTNDQIFQAAFRTNLATGVTIKSASLYITQSAGPIDIVCNEVLPEPYITIPNYYNSDVYPIINNATENRLSTTHYQVDYTTNAFKPTNFDLIISNSSPHYQIQDSFYTSQRNIIPRYLGSKNTSEFINKWTKSNQNKGNFGKTSPIDLTSQLLAYCSFNGGYAPEHMNAVGVKLKWLIRDKDNIIAPSTTKGSVTDVQNAFTTGENVRIDYIESQGNDGVFEILKGGYRIEPIFYNQSAHYLDSGGVNEFSETITLTNINQNESSIVNNYTSILTIQSPYSLTNTSFSPTLLNNKFYTKTQGPSITTELDTNGRYIITQNIIDDGIDIILNADFRINQNFYISSYNAPSSPPESTISIAIYRDRGGDITYLGETSLIFQDGETKNLTTSVGIPLYDLIVGDEYGVALKRTYNSTTQITNVQSNQSNFKISQVPLPNPNINVSGSAGELFFNSTDLNQIHTTSSYFIQFYGDSLVKQKDITGSGFFDIKHPVEFLPGDEFRFEGLEDKVYMIGKTNTDGIIFNSSSISLPVTFTTSPPDSGSFTLNGINLYFTASSGILPNTNNTIYIPVGATTSDTTDNAVEHINNSSSILPYSNYFQYMTASNDTGTLVLRYTGSLTTQYNWYLAASGSFTGSFATPSLNIILDKQISGSNTNINQFLVRRYVEDGSSIIYRNINGENGSGTLYAIPEYITENLDLSLETLTSELVNKGLI